MLFILSLNIFENSLQEKSVPCSMAHMVHMVWLLHVHWLCSYALSCGYSQWTLDWSVLSHLPALVCLVTPLQNLLPFCLSPANNFSSYKTQGKRTSLRRLLWPLFPALVWIKCSSAQCAMHISIIGQRLYFIEVTLLQDIINTWLFVEWVNV